MRTVIVGAGEVGSHLAKMLCREGGEVTVIDTDEDRINRVKSIADVATVMGSPTSIKVLRQADVPRADLFISVYPFATQEMNIVSAILARQLGAKKVTARINDEDFMEAKDKLMFKEMGIDLMHPWQENANMPYDIYLDKYADKFAIMGGINIQNALGILERDELEAEIRRIFGLLRGKRWVVCTSHFVQKHCKIEDLGFAYDLIYKLARE